MKRRSVMTGCLSLLTLFLSIVLLSFSWAQDSIVVGVFEPLTGALAGAGEEHQRGFILAEELINKSGGIFNKKLKVVYEDDRGDPTVGVAAVEKLILKDKVSYILGGYGSTTIYAVLGVLRKHNMGKIKAISISVGGSSPLLEKDFGMEKWFFNTHPWAYYYMETVRDFFKEIKPNPQSVFIAYSDELYGKSLAEPGKEYLGKAGFNVVGYEPYNEKAVDFTALITKAKSINPDVFLYLGHVGSSIIITKQTKELGFTPKLSMDTFGVGLRDYMNALGSDANFQCGMEFWIPGINYPASTQYPKLLVSSKDYVTMYQKKFPGREPTMSPEDYVALISLKIAIEEARSTDPEKVISALEKIDTMTPWGPFKFGKGRMGGIHSGPTNILVFQIQEGKRGIVWPNRWATSAFVYPKPPWQK
jgi:branched-chain amino acid transport system substrate-binding protein